MKKLICGAMSVFLLGLSVLPLAACGDNNNQPAHAEHEYATAWSKDETYHWHAPVCDDTTEPKDKAEHDFDADHKCTVCEYVKANLGTLMVADVTAWSDVESEFSIVFKDASKAEAVAYEYDNEKITLDAERRTVKVVSGFTGSVQVKVRSENHRTATFTVTCNELPGTGRHPHAAYSAQLGQGKLDTGATIEVGDKTTVFIGDSFFDRRYFWTDFYETYSGKDVFLAGISETTTNDWEDYMNEVFAVFGEKAPKNIVIHLGTNNIGTGQTAAETENGLRHFLTLLHKKFPQTKIYYFAITSRWDDDGTYNKTINTVNGQTQTWCKGKDWIKFVDSAWRLTKDKLNPNHGGSYIHPLLSSYSIFVEELQGAGCFIESKA